MTFDHDFGNSFPLFSSLLKRRERPEDPGDVEVEAVVPVGELQLRHGVVTGPSLLVVEPLLLCLIVF